MVHWHISAPSSQFKKSVKDCLHFLSELRYLKMSLCHLILSPDLMWASLMAQRVKNLPAVQETQGTRVQSLGQEDPLEEDMATRCSILARRIPWTEEPGGSRSMVSQRVRHIWSDWACNLLYWMPWAGSKISYTYICLNQKMFTLCTTEELDLLSATRSQVFSRKCFSLFCAASSV